MNTETIVKFLMSPIISTSILIVFGILISNYSIKVIRYSKRAFYRGSISKKERNHNINVALRYICLFIVVFALNMASIAFLNLM